MADKYNVNGEMKDGYPRYQYSRFDNKQGQYVVRSNDLADFKLDVDYVNEAVGVVPTVSKQEQVIDRAFNQPSVQTALGNCSKCGAENIIYKKSGKVGCSKFCWNKKADSGYKQY